jgi:hypothetical protein
MCALREHARCVSIRSCTSSAGVREQRTPLKRTPLKLDLSVRTSSTRR